MKLTGGDSGTEIGLRSPEGDPDPENDLSPPTSCLAVSDAVRNCTVR